MGFKKCKCKFCNKVIEKEEDKISDTFGTKTKINIHRWCEEGFLKGKKEKRDFDELYDYIRYNILNYSKGKQLTPNMRNKLQSLRNGEFLIKGKKVSNNGYSYEVILTTFKAKKIDIDNAVYGKEFESENRKFSYIMAIVLNEINDVAKRVERVLEAKKREEKKTYEIEVEDTEKSFEEYKEIQKNKNKNKVANLLEDLL